MKMRVAEFHVDRPTPVWGLESCQYAQILVRSHGRPLGWLTLPVEGSIGALPAEIILEAAQRRLNLSEAPQSEPAIRPPITVIICTRDRPLALRGCLESIKKIDYPNFEVVVVDNASRGRETAGLTADGGFRYVREDRVGLDQARNCGARAAANDIVAYTDDDVRVDSKWLDGIARGFALPDVACVTGLICPLELETPAQCLFEQYGGMGKGFQPRLFDPNSMSPQALLPAHSVGVGANMAYRRRVLLDLGGFDPCLDVGTPSSGGGDLNMFHRILAAGQKIYYEPTALVWHQHRRTMPGLHSQIYNNGRAFGCYLLKIAATGTVPASTVAGFALREWIGGWLLKSFLGNRQGRNFSLVAAETWGALHSPWAYLKTYRKPPWR